MNELPDLERQIRERLAAADARRDSKRHEMASTMAELHRRTTRFNEQAVRLVDSVLRPRVETLMKLFPHVGLLPPTPAHPYQVVCSLMHADSFPATATLTLAVGSDHELENIVTSYALEILPVFFEFERTDQRTFPLENLDDGAVAAWFDGKLLRFIDTCLRVSDVEQYQQDNIVVDPVCGMHMKKDLAAAQMEFGGKTFYFCVEECQKKFAAEPGRYLGQPVEQQCGSNGYEQSVGGLRYAESSGASRLAVNTRAGGLRRRDLRRYQCRVASRRAPSSRYG